MNINDVVVFIQTHNVYIPWILGVAGVGMIALGARVKPKRSCDLY